MRRLSFSRPLLPRLCGRARPTHDSAHLPADAYRVQRHRLSWRRKTSSHLLIAHAFRLIGIVIPSHTLEPPWYADGYVVDSAAVVSLSVAAAA